jgi:hypothetical protein
MVAKSATSGKKPSKPSKDKNIVDRALKKAILHRKNSLFYKTRKGAQMGTCS